MSLPARISLFAALGVIGAVVAAAAVRPAPLTPAPTIGDGPRVIVVAELFTSEGCSSCPPADDLLSRLVSTQPVEGVEVVALGSHVDYWDGQGWKDSFSSPLFTQRQSAYDKAVFRSNSIYTPQLVVDGTFQGVGSDKGDVRKVLLKAAKLPKAQVWVSAMPSKDAAVQVDVRVQIPSAIQKRAVADIVVAVTEDGLVSQVQRGENRGRTMAHSAVVRSLTTVGQVSATDDTGSASTVVRLEPGWNAAHLHIVAFIQEQHSRRILGAGQSPIVPRSATQ